jgi:carbon-monoxide dehydrogenase medium subunit
VEKALRGKPASAIADAAGRAADGVSALSDNYASADFRKHLACVYARRALEAAVARGAAK